MQWNSISLHSAAFFLGKIEEFEKFAFRISIHIFWFRWFYVQWPSVVGIWKKRNKSESHEWAFCIEGNSEHFLHICWTFDPFVLYSDRGTQKWSRAVICSYSYSLFLERISIFRYVFECTWKPPLKWVLTFGVALHSKFKWLMIFRLYFNVCGSWNTHAWKTANV